MNKKLVNKAMDVAEKLEDNSLILINNIPYRLLNKMPQPHERFYRSDDIYRLVNEENHSWMPYMTAKSLEDMQKRLVKSVIDLRSIESIEILEFPAWSMFGNFPKKLQQ